MEWRRRKGFQRRTFLDSSSEHTPTFDLTCARLSDVSSDDLAKPLFFPDLLGKSSNHLEFNRPVVGASPFENGSKNPICAFNDRLGRLLTVWRIFQGTDLELWQLCFGVGCGFIRELRGDATDRAEGSDRPLPPPTENVAGDYKRAAGAYYGVAAAAGPSCSKASFRLMAVPPRAPRLFFFFFLPFLSFLLFRRVTQIATCPAPQLRRPGMQSSPGRAEN